jgi:hypothetical protein
MLFRAESVQPIKRIFPFDSGAFDNELYDNALHRDMNLEDFGLEPSPDTPGRVISFFLALRKII